jgi:hypothetical protein
MAKKGAAAHIAGAWVHVFEQDTDAGAVFRPEMSDIPLSRRPRERIEMHADGSATMWLGGPDDRYVAQPATWSVEGDDVVVRDARDAVRLRVLDRTPDRLLVEMHRPAARN